MTYQSRDFNKGFSIFDDVEQEFQNLKQGLESGKVDNTVVDNSVSYSETIEKLEFLANKFHHIARQIRVRHKNRPTLEINDEYDVQDLFHSLLTLYFDDIRREESNPSYAGANSRADFLLKPEKTIIEIKKTREGLKNKQLGEELTVDIQKYQAHPNCKTFVCFVYDPQRVIDNPRGLSRDLEQSTDKIKVKVFIR